MAKSRARSAQHWIILHMTITMTRTSISVISICDKWYGYLKLDMTSTIDTQSNPTDLRTKHDLQVHCTLEFGNQTFPRCCCWNTMLALVVGQETLLFWEKHCIMGYAYIVYRICWETLINPRPHYHYKRYIYIHRLSFWRSKNEG